MDHSQLIYPVIYSIGAISSLYTSYLFLRPMIKVNVECWFCMTECKVTLAERNSWKCSTCNQYNGFNKDGSYNRIIPEQYDFNHKDYCQKQSAPLSHSFFGPFRYEQNRLCDDCNAKQAMKIKLIASFVPINEQDFDQEFSIFKMNLEQTYQLCNECEILIKKLINEPNTKPREETGWQIRKFSPANFADEKSNRIWQQNPRAFSKNFLVYFILHFASVATLFYLLCLSFNAHEMNIHGQQDYSFGLKDIFPEKHVIIYIGYYHYIISLAFVAFLIRMLIQPKPNGFFDAFRLCFWIVLFTNDFNYHLLSFNRKELIYLHQSIFILLILSDLAKTLINCADIDLNFWAKSFRPKEESKTYSNIRQQIQALSLTEPSKNNGFSSGFFDFHPPPTTINTDIAELFGSPKNTCKTKKLAQFSFVSDKHDFDKPTPSALILPYKNNNNSPPRILNYFIQYDSSLIQNHQIYTNAKNNIYWNILITFLIILVLTTLFLMIIILTLPLSFQYSLNPNGLNLNLSFR